MGFLVWIIVGGIVGWLASLVMRTDGQQGILLNVVVGIVGAFIGGWFGALLFEQSGSWAMGFYGSAVMALIAAGMAVGLRTAATGKAKATAVATPAVAK